MAAEDSHPVGGHPPIDISETFGPDSGTELGVAVWMISEMRPKALGKEKYGEFEDGGAYIILNTLEVGKKYDLFFWLGDKVPVGERGVCAYMVVDLDQHLNDVPVQYRECQGNESAKFLACIQKEAGGIRVVEGEGGGSAFKHVDAGSGLDFNVRLLQLKGRRSVKMEEVPCKCSSLNEGDVFLLDMKDTIYMWEGKDANRYEKVRGGEVMAKIVAQRGCHQKPVRLSETPAELPNFFAGIGGEGPIATADEGGDDNQYEVKAAERLRLFRLGEDGRTFTENTDVEKPLPKECLDSAGIFLIDSGSATTGIFVWIGKDVCAKLSRGTMAATEYWLATQQGKVEGNVPVSRLNESYENQIFKSHFQYPFDPPQVQGFGDHPSGEVGHVAHMRGNEIDLGALQAERAQHSRSVAEARDALDHGGNVLIWRIENFKKEAVSEDQHGQFCDGDSYIVLHTYEDKNGKEHAIIYFWQGLESSTDEKGAVAIEAVRMDNEDFHGHATQVRVVMGKEPESFLILFKGRMIINHGGVDSGFKTKFLCRQQSSVDFESKTNTRMYHVHGTHIFNTKAIQVRARARELHSDDAFVVLTGGGIASGGLVSATVWKGRGASEDEQQIALAAAKILLGAGHEGDIAVLNEGEEGNDFWAALGGKEEYISEPAMANASYEARLFHVSNASGALRIDECFDFSQEDLIVEDVMILDAFNHVFVWVGEESAMDERAAGLETAQKYIETSAPNDGRSMDTPVIVVKQQSEPLLFTCHFDNWNDAFFDKMADVEELLHAEKEEQEKKKQEEQLAKVERHNALRRQHTQELLAKQEGDRAKNLEMDKAKSSTPSWAKNKLHHIEEGDESKRGSVFFPGEAAEGEAAAKPFEPPERKPSEHSPSKALSQDSPTKRRSQEAILFRSMDPETIREQRKKEQADAPVVKYADPMVTHFPYEQLKGAGQKPADVDPTHKELYLSDEQFQELFGQSKEDYKKLPAWKTKTMKQKHDLY